MKLLSPEEFIQKHVAPQKALPKILEEFRIECQVMDSYKSHILNEYDNDFNRVIGRVNFLMRACLNGNKATKMAIDQFLVEYGKFYASGEFGIDFNKIINDEPKRSDQ